MSESLEVRTLDERAEELLSRAGSDPDARNELIEAYRPLADYLARRFAGRGEPLEDLVQVACVGLIKAVDRFDPERGVRFSTYATPTVIGELKRHFRDKGWAMRVPRRLQEMGLHVRRLVSEVSQELGRSPTVAEIAQRAELTEEQVLEALEVGHAYSVESIDGPDDEDIPVRQLAAEDGELELLERWATVGPLLRELPERERLILYYRFAHQMTQSKIAEELGISQMHVSRLLSRALTKVRAAAKQSGA